MYARRPRLQLKLLDIVYNYYSTYFSCCRPIRARRRVFRKHFISVLRKHSLFIRFFFFIYPFQIPRYRRSGTVRVSRNHITRMKCFLGRSEVFFLRIHGYEYKTYYHNRIRRYKQTSILYEHNILCLYEVVV